MRHPITFALLVAATALMILMTPGCATTGFFKKLDTSLLKRQHRTQLVVVNHSPLKYFWEITGGNSTYQYQMQKGSYPGVPPVWQSTAGEELDSAELAYRGFRPLPPVTCEIYQQTLQRALSSSRHVQLLPGFLVLTDSTAKNAEVLDSLLLFDIPYDSIGARPDWYLVLRVHDIGLMRTGIRTGSGLAAALSGLLTTLITEKQWSVWLSCTVQIADAQSKIILWKDRVQFRQPVLGKLDELLKNEKQRLTRGFVEALCSTAAKHSADLVNNRWIDWNDPSIAKLHLSKSEADSLNARLVSAKPL